jgi:UrcA family protein
MTTLRSLNIVGLTLSALVYTAGVAQAAPAQPFDSPPSRLVRFADLDLNTREGALVLYRRIAAAARAVCGESERPGSPFPPTYWRNCVETATRSAVISVDRPQLTALYSERAGNAAPLRLSAHTR